ncbi:MAG: FKBP-type peptidyl-prolyl cis-trans isomerase [Spirochaetaceae bacterium]|jgi:FKBP-type peptidyl-prolyl cis-trans isomerase FkpA|nr:FKBP-type peptidyl-prolyl cis-trans isomerase [Spirochaetaceae bacterium]
MAKQWFCMVLCAAGIITAVSARGVSDGKLGSTDPDISYAFGVWFGSQFQTTDLEFDYLHFALGLRDVMEDKAAISTDEALAVVQDAYTAALERQAALAKVQEDAYLAENAAQPQVYTTESGLQYEVISEGGGSKPLPTDTVEVNYEGYLVDGTLFDSSYLYGESATFPLDAVIPGWSEGLQLMTEGSTYKFYIPSNLAYGPNGIESIIPPYSTLIFTVEFLSIKTEEDLSEESSN